MRALFRLIAPAAILLLPSVAYADCSWPSPQRSLARADVAFRGVARDVRPLGGTGGTSGPWRGSIITFDVSRVWKGAVGPTFALHEVEGTAEDAGFTAGQEYIVFASMNTQPTSVLFRSTGPSFAAGPCSGGLLMSPATPAPVEIGPGRPPMTQPPATEPQTARRFADCDRPRSAQFARDRSDIILRGRARNVRMARDRYGSWTGTIVTFDVSRSWKGITGPEFVLHNTPESVEDVQFEPGLEYLVFATRNPSSVAAQFGLSGPSFAVRRCSGTAPMFSATRYLIDLGAGRLPATEPRVPDPRTLQ
jgi:hypothetical protein